MTVAVTLAIEDIVSEAVARRLVASTNQALLIEQVIGNRGFGFLKSKLPLLNSAAYNGVVSVVVADLDEAPCPIDLRQDWLGRAPHPNLFFRVAVKEIEAWLLADHEGFSDFFGVPMGRIPQISDEIPDPKRTVINLVRGSRRKDIKRAMLPRDGSGSSVGPEYNAFMVKYAESKWELLRARGRSQSLNRAYLALQRFEPAVNYNNGQ